ncbi:MAG: DUF4058 family protein [Caldilinea sp. CFX5]|nr:DUF4058 family protein [Caldilinea sp. CFX5]
MTKSPFPGMDPFLERPAKWSSVHTRLINAISDQLAERLAPNFYVEKEYPCFSICDNCALCACARYVAC